MDDNMLIRNWESSESDEDASLKHRAPKEATSGIAPNLIVTDGEDDFSIQKIISGDEVLDFKPLIVTKLTNFEQIIDYKKNDSQMREISPLPADTDHPVNASSRNGNGGVEESNQYKRKDSKMREILPLAPSQPENSSSSSNVTTQHGRVEYILEEGFQKPETHGFYCPNCRTCIDKVVVQHREQEPKGRFRCTSCFSFLIPAANWVFPNWKANEVDGGSDDEGTRNIPANQTRDTTFVPEDQQSKDPPPRHSIRNTIRDGVMGALAISAFKPSTDTDDPPPHHSLGNPSPGVPEIPGVPTIPDSDQPATDSNDPTPPHHTLQIPEEQEQGPEHGGIIDGDDTSQTPPTDHDSDGRADRKLEVVKSIVYGGLVETIASLGVVTSAASSDSKTLNIFALAVANLISGLFILVNNLWELIPNQPQRGSNATDAKARRYQELLGHKEHFLLHTTLAILAFLIFGLVPPVVYGFSFQNRDDKDLKLAAVAGASLLCITLLAIAKVYTNQSRKFMEYFKTVVYYIGTSAVASIVAYLAGKLMKQVLESLGWFESGQAVPNFSLGFPQMSTQSHAWESY